MSDECSGHRRRDANLRLATTFRCGQRRVVFAQIADSQTGEQTLANFFHGHLAFAIDEGIYNRRRYAGRTAGRRSDNQMAARVFLRRRMRFLVGWWVELIR